MFDRGLGVSTTSPLLAADSSLAPCAKATDDPYVGFKGPLHQKAETCSLDLIASEATTLPGNLVDK